LRVGRKADDLALQKKIIVAESKEVKTGCNLAESSREGCGSKRGCFANGGDAELQKYECGYFVDGY
jgi:hypothetical protein